MGPRYDPEMSGTLNADGIEQAARRLEPVVRRTALEENQRLSELLGSRILLKREDSQVCRSYKVRGAFNLVSSLTDEEQRRGVVCASAGNHGQGVAFACRRLGIRGRVFVPSNTPRQKRERIAAFGGDPGNVTLFGQSAGATLIGSILATPEAAGLFHRAIVQSGNGLGAFSPEQAARVTRAAATALGVEPTVTAFAAVPDDRLLALLPHLTGLDLRTATRTDPLLGLSPYGLVLDRQPAESVAAGAGTDVALLIGTTTEEANLYLAPQGDLTASTTGDVHALAARIHSDPAALVAEYRAKYPRAHAGRLRSALLGDALFRTGNRRLAEAHASHRAAPTHTYAFAWRSPALDGQLGAAHTTELPFVFDRLDLPALHGPHGLLGPTPPPARLAARMHGAWVSFAHTGDPGWASSETHRFAGDEGRGAGRCAVVGG